MEEVSEIILAQPQCKGLGLNKKGNRYIVEQLGVMEVVKMALFPETGKKGLDYVKKEFDNYFGGFPFPFSNENFESILIDVHETNSQVIAECDVPGIKNKEDIHIDIRDARHLKVSAVKESITETHNAHIDRQERSVGRIERMITLPTEVEIEGTTAHYKNGVLTITMPKVNEGIKSQIDVDFE